MAFEETFLVSDKLALVTEADITALADWFGEVLSAPLPRGYIEYMTTLGEGTYCDEVWVYLPARIMQRVEESRLRWSGHYFWEKGGDVLTKDGVLASVPVGGSADGDEIIFSPKYPQQLFVLPRHDDVIYTMPNGLLDPIEWISGDRLESDPPGFRYFEPSRDRAIVELVNDEQHLDAAGLAGRMVDRWKGQEVREIVIRGHFLCLRKLSEGVCS